VTKKEKKKERERERKPPKRRKAQPNTKDVPLSLRGMRFGRTLVGKGRPRKKEGEKKAFLSFLLFFFSKLRRDKAEKEERGRRERRK